MANCMPIQACVIEIQTPKLEPDRPLHDQHAARRIAQQYSSVTFVSWVFHFRQNKLGGFSNLLLRQVLLSFLKITEV
jgi:hypothetical protein